MTISLPASPPANSFPPIAPKIVGLFRIIGLSMAFLYQDTEILGMLMPKPISFQYHEKWGSFREYTEKYHK
jgi:hypothetical protein